MKASMAVSVTNASTANCSPACLRRSASRERSVTSTTRAGRTARSTIERRRNIAPNFCAKLPTPVRPAKPGLPSVGSLPLFPIPTTPSEATNNPLSLLLKVVQVRESGQADHYECREVGGAVTRSQIGWGYDYL